MILERHKPRSSARTRLVVAALIWAAVGSGLVIVGGRRVAGGGAVWIGSLPLAVAAGALKGRHLLAPRAAANARRITAAGDDRCLGGVFSWPAWALVVSMMALGWALRRSPVPPRPVGWIYVAVGTALLWGAAAAWPRQEQRQDGA